MHVISRMGMFWYRRPWAACIYAGRAFSPRSQGEDGRHKYTGGALSASTQTQAGSVPVVKRGLYFLYVCDSLWLNRAKGRVLPRREVLPVGRRVITWEHIREENINVITGQQDSVLGVSWRHVSNMLLN